MLSEVPRRSKVARTVVVMAVGVNLALLLAMGAAPCPAGRTEGLVSSFGAGEAGPPPTPVLLPEDLDSVQEPLPGVFTCAQPRERDFVALRRGGIRTVVDLRLPEEARGFDEAVAARLAGLDYVNIPFMRTALTAREIEAFRRVLDDPARRPVLVHCAATNRVGGILLPRLMLDEGQRQAEAIALAMKVGLRSPELLEAALQHVREVRGREGRARPI